MTASNALLNALRAKAGRVRCLHATTTSWHSATFAGERHELHLVAETAEAAAALRENLAEHEFDLPGHWVADVRADLPEMVDGELRLHLEAVTVAVD